MSAALIALQQIGDTAALPAGEAAIVAGIIGLVEISKRAGLQSKYAPLLAVAIAILLNGGYTGWDMTGPELLVAIAEGLSASGVYSGTKAIAGK